MSSPPAAELRTAAVALARTLDPELLTGEQAAAIVHDLAIAEKACATARMFAAVRVARTDAWRGQGHASAADWLAAQTGISVRAAASQLGTATKAGKLPKTADAMRNGRLSPDQAGAITDAATADPAAEDDLLSAAATDTTAALREKAARAKAAATDTATRERRIRAERTVRTRIDADGAFCLWLRGPAIDGVRLEALLRPFREQAFRTGRGTTHDTYDNRSYDAFFAMVDQLRTEPGDEATRPPGGNNVKVIVRVDHSALVRGHTLAGETCDVAGLGPIPASAVRDLLQDAFLAVLVTKGRDVHTVAHQGRRLNAHQRTAIEWTGTRCTNGACNRTVAIQIDHRVPYNDERVTKLDNQDPLCPECHRRKTHHGWHLEPGSGPRRFLPPREPSRC